MIKIPNILPSFANGQNITINYTGNLNNLLNTQIINLSSWFEGHNNLTSLEYQGHTLYYINHPINDLNISNDHYIRYYMRHKNINHVDEQLTNITGFVGIINNGELDKLTQVSEGVICHTSPIKNKAYDDTVIENSTIDELCIYIEVSAAIDAEEAWQLYISNYELVCEIYQIPRLYIYTAWGAGRLLDTICAFDINTITRTLSFNITNYTIFEPQLYYRFQIEQSNYATIKYINIPTTTVKLYPEFEAVFSYSNYYDEYLFSTQFYLIDNDTSKVLESSPEIIYNHTNQLKSSLEETYQFKQHFSSNGRYQVQVQYKTCNQYTATVQMSNPICFSVIEGEADMVDWDIQYLNENNCFQIQTSLDGELYKIERDSDNNITGYIYIKDIKAREKVYDMTIDNNIRLQHTYALLLRHNTIPLNNQGDMILGTIYVSANQNTKGYDYIILSDSERVLKINFNPKVSSFKQVQQTSKMDTIGGQFPSFFSNGIVNYKEFPINGLISYHMDQNNFFIANNIQNDEVYRLETKNTTSIDNQVTYDNTNILQKELLFKQEVLAWLNNNKPKLFRSPYEGNYIVRLSNISFTPEDKLGRMLHNFTCTATEIDTYNLSNLFKYNLLYKS